LAVALWWGRREPRLFGDAGLNAALKEAGHVVALLVLPAPDAESVPAAQARRDFLLGCVRSPDSGLRGRAASCVLAAV